MSLSLGSPATLPTTASTGSDPGDGRGSLRHAGWPLVLLFGGYPLWWLMGIASLLPLVLAVPMALQLRRRGRVLTPPRFGWWLLFLAWVAVGVVVLWADAPGAAPGGAGGGRLFTFAFRVCWYLAITVVLLWVGNSDERDLPTTRVVRLLAWMFVVTSAGGLLGVIAPAFEMSSLLQAFLPTSLARNDFVASLTRVQAASIQDVLGVDEGRPIAPFAFANSWGSNLSLFLPFFVLAWMGRDAGWRRFAAPIVLLVAAAPIIYSLNRGLWASLALGAVLLLGRSGVLSRAARAGLAGVITVVVGLLFVFSPLGAMVESRLANAHSNDRRAQLMVQTVVSTAQGSPVIGFGNTRDVQGSFFSIAGGARPDCKACGVPPLGTQGQLWMVIFSQGFGGLALFLGFLFVQLKRRWSGRTGLHLAGTTVVVFLICQLTVYDTYDLPLYTTMIAVALMWRHDRQALAQASAATTSDVRPT